MAIVILDPGHGGADSGACGFGLQEKTLNLGIALACRKMLLANGHTVHLTRDSDVGMGLSDRGRFSVGHKGDIFISIHHDAGSATARGCHAFFDNPSATNGADLAGQVAKMIAGFINVPFSWGGPASTWTHDGKDSHLGVLVGGDNWKHVTACLVECCFITSPEDVKIIKAPGYFDTVARALVTAIHRHRGLPTPRFAPAPAEETGADTQDPNECSPWATEARDWAKAQGLTDGTRPREAMTREECWCLLQRVAEKFGLGAAKGKAKATA